LEVVTKPFLLQFPYFGYGFGKIFPYTFSIHQNFSSLHSKSGNFVTKELGYDFQMSNTSVATQRKFKINLTRYHTLSRLEVTPTVVMAFRCHTSHGLKLSRFLHLPPI